MIVLIITGLFAVFLTYLDQIGELKNGMKYGFFIVTLIAAIHYDFGNDYMIYYDFFIEWGNLTWSWNYESYKEIFRDPGWVILNLLFQPFGFFILVAALSVFQNWIYYNFIKKYVLRSYWTWAVVFYLFSTYFYLINMSMMRQGLSVALFVWALPMIVERKWLQATIILIIAYSIHKTSLILFPFLLLSIFPMKNGRVLGLILPIVFLLMLVFKDKLGILLQPVDTFSSMEDISMKLDVYRNNHDVLSSFGVGFVLKCIPLFVASWYLITKQSKNPLNNGIIFTASFGTLFLILGAQVYMIMRASIYFYAMLLAAVPYCFKQIKQTLVRNILLVSFMSIILYEYWDFMNSSIYAPYYTEFHTIFDII